METQFLCWVTFLSRKRWSREEGGGFLSHDPAALDCDMRSFSSASHYWLLVAIHSLSPVWLFLTPWTAARQASLSFTIFPELAQTHVYWVSDAIQPSYSLSHPCPPALNQGSIRVFSNELALHIRCPKYWRCSFSIIPSNEYSGLISFRIDWLDLLAVQGALKSLVQHHSLKASILWCSAFFMVQLSHPYMTTRKTIALTRWTK